MGGSLGYTVPAAGLSLAASGGGLLLHESGTFSEWGAGGSLRLTPGVAGRGVALRVEPTWGTAGGSAVRLWTAPGAARAGNAATVPAGRLAAELSYGVAAFRGHGLLTPYAGSGPVRPRRAHVATGWAPEPRSRLLDERGGHPQRARRRPPGPGAYPHAARQPGPLKGSPPQLAKAKAAPGICRYRETRASPSLRVAKPPGVFSSPYPAAFFVSP